MLKTNYLILAAVTSLAVAAPSFADYMGSAKSFSGTTTAMLVDVPEGAIMDAGYKCPAKFTHSLAGTFGDEKGYKQLFVGALIGIPTGAVFGAGYGVVVGAKHALKCGWDKPFSKDSFIVANQEK